MNKLRSIGIEVGQGRYYEEMIYSSALIYNLINNAIATYLRKFDLTPGKFNILMVIKHQGGKEGISQVDISKQLVVTASNMTKLLDKLQKEGSVTRGSLAGDRRVKVIKITPKGSKLLDEAWPGYIKILQGLASKLDHQDQGKLSGLLIQWLDKLMEDAQ